MHLNNQSYDVSKWIVLIFMPAFAVLVNGLGELYSWESTTIMVSTINLVNVFLGTILQLSSKKYHGLNKSDGGSIIGRKHSKAS